MTRFVTALLCAVPLGSMLLAQTPAAPQTAPANQQATEQEKAGAYYHFAMGRLYSELAASEANKSDYATKAIDHYEQALKLDPKSGIIFEELTDLYIQANRLADAVAEAEEILKQDPENLDARRMLGRVYTRMIGESQGGHVDEKNVRRAIDQYQQITQKAPQDAESWVMLGRLYRVTNDSPDAEKAYNAALAADPANEDAMTGLAQLYADLGDTRKAIEKLKAVTDKSPNERTLMFLAEQYESLRDFKDAAATLRKALDMAPDNLRIEKGLAQDLMYSGQSEEALKLFTELAGEDPRDWESLLAMAEIYADGHDMAKARESMNKAKAVSPGNIEVRYQDAELLKAEGKTDAALAELKSMSDDTMRRTYTDPEARLRARILDEYGILLRSNGKYEQAVDAFRQLSGLTTDFAVRGEIQVIDTYRQAKDYASALKEADAAVKKYADDRHIKEEHAAVLADSGKVDEGAAELRPIHDLDAQLALAQIYERAKRYSDMPKPLEEAEKLAKSNDEKENIYFMRGAMYERLKKYDASETAFRQVLSLNPENAEASNYLGYMLADRGVRLEEAYQLIKKALDQVPNNGAFLDSLGWVYYRQGKLDEAQDALVRALEKTDTREDPTVHDHLGDVYFKMGKTREAVAQWQVSLQGFHKSPQQADPEDVAKVSRKLDDARVKLAKEKK